MFNSGLWSLILPLLPFICYDCKKQSHNQSPTNRRTHFVTFLHPYVQTEANYWTWKPSSAGCLGRYIAHMTWLLSWFSSHMLLVKFKMSSLSCLPFLLPLPVISHPSSILTPPLNCLYISVIAVVIDPHYVRYCGDLSVAFPLMLFYVSIWKVRVLSCAPQLQKSKYHDLHDQQNKQYIVLRKQEREF